MSKDPETDERSTDEWPAVVVLPARKRFRPWLWSLGLLAFLALEVLFIRLFKEAS